MDDNFKLSSEVFEEILNEQLNFNKSVKLRVTGNSMIPFLADKRDYVFLEKFNGKAKKGDILFYKRANSKCVLHRVIKATDTSFWFIGDSQLEIEGPIDINQILAECNEVIRKGKTVKKNDPVWNFFSKIWINIINFRHPVIKFIGKVK